MKSTAKKALFNTVFKIDLKLCDRDLEQMFERAHLLLTENNSDKFYPNPLVNVGVLLRKSLVEN